MPELLVRRLVFFLGYQYRLHARALLGHPDLVSSKRHKVVFLEGWIGSATGSTIIGRISRRRRPSRNWRISNTT